MRRILKIIFLTMFCFISTFVTAHAEEFPRQGTIGAALNMNVLNFGLGPGIEYWATSNINISGGLGALADFTSYGIRGNYLFNNEFKIFGIPARPLGGIGYTSIQGPEESYAGVSAETEGSGIEIYGGFLQPAPYISKNVFIRPEFVYSTVKLEGTATYLGEKLATVEADYSAFSLGFGIVYYF